MASSTDDDERDMSDGADEERATADGITVLHVDDEPDFLDLTKAFLSRHAGQRFELLTETSAAAGIERLETASVDCIVSDYDMPGENGLEFLEEVRESAPELPFILFTGKGGEEVASDAISAGVTDYLQKGTGTEAYDLLANRIANAVARHRARTNYREIMGNVPDGIVVHEPDTGAFLDMNEQFARLFGYTPEEFFEVGFEAIHLDEEPYTLADALDRIEQAIEEGEATFQWPGVRKDGTVRWFEVHLTRARLDGRLRLLGVVRDVSERRERKRELQYERDRLAALFTSVPEPVVHVRVDDEAARIVQFNDAFSDVFGYDEAAVVGESLDDLIVPERLTDEGDSINELTHDADLIELEVVREAHDGERTFLFKAAPIVQAEDDVEWVGTYVDLSGRER